MIRVTVVADGRRLGSVILDGERIHIIATPKGAEQELWDAIAKVYGAIQGGERAEVERVQALECEVIEREKHRLAYANQVKIATQTLRDEHAGELKAARDALQSVSADRDGWRLRCESAERKILAGER